MMRPGCYLARRDLQAVNELAARKQRRLESHLVACSRCRDARDEWRRVDGQIETFLPRQHPPFPIRAAVLDRLASQAAPTPRFRAGFRRVRLASRLVGAVAVALAASITIPYRLSSGSFSVQRAGATTWPAVHADIGFPFTLDQTRPGHMLIGAFGQIYESYDSGQTAHRLSVLPPHLTIRGLLIDRAHPAHYIVATKRSIFDSWDRGQNWTLERSNLLGLMTMFLVQDPRDARRLYVGPSVLWSSGDDGHTWSRPGPGRVFAPYGIQALSILPSGELMTGIWGGGVAFSRDGGRSWSRHALGLNRRVTDVTRTPDGRLWATTQGGLYSLSPGARSWRYRGPARTFLTTSLVAVPGALLAAGNGAVYRSTDGGSSWVDSSQGLPLAPYVSDLAVDPFHPSHVFAAVNSDGVFLSVDGGRTWQSRNGGLPVGVVPSPVHWVPFIRRGTLWLTDELGSDPGVISLDNDVRAAAVSPDGLSVAYVAGTAGRWHVAEMAAGGSAARVVARLNVASQPHLLWSADSALLVVWAPGARVVTAGSHARGAERALLGSDQTVVGWAPGGRSLLIWDESARALMSERLLEGALSRRLPFGTFRAAPVPNSGGTLLAGLSQGRLSLASGDGMSLWSRRVGHSCGWGGWTTGGTHLILRCNSSLVLIDKDGRTAGRAPVPAPARLGSWATPREALIFARGALWRAPFGGSPQRLVAPADPA